MEDQKLTKEEMTVLSTELADIQTILQSKKTISPQVLSAVDKMSAELTKVVTVQNADDASSLISTLKNVTDALKQRQQSR
jgi:hypothetical protein